MKWTIGTKISGLVAFVIAIFIILGIISLLMTNKLRTSIGWNTHTYQVLQNQKQILLLLKEAEMGNHSFIIMEEEKYLEKYNQLGKNVMKKIDDGLELTKDNPKQQQRIANLKLLVVNFNAGVNCYHFRLKNTTTW